MVIHLNNQMLTFIIITIIARLFPIHLIVRWWETLS